VLSEYCPEPVRAVRMSASIRDTFITGINSLMRGRFQA
jgi:hypothetical protein